MPWRYAECSAKKKKGDASYVTSMQMGERRCNCAHHGEEERAIVLFEVRIQSCQNSYGVNSSTLQEGSTEAHAPNSPPMHYEYELG